MEISGEQAAVRRPVLPYLALAWGILSLSLSGLFVRWSQAPGPVTSFYRMFLASLILAGPVLLRWRKQGAPKRVWLLVPVLGGTFTALDHGTWSMAVQATRVANAMLLNNIAPLWVALFAGLVWRERLRPVFWLGLLITLAGMAVVVGGDFILAPSLNAGNALAVVSSLFYAGYFLATQRGRVQLDPLSYLLVVNSSASLTLLAANLLMGNAMTGYPPSTWQVFFATAIISQISGYFAIAYALGHLPASLVSPTMMIQPVISALLAIPLLGENLAAGQWGGALAVIAGIALVNASRRSPV